MQRLAIDFTPAEGAVVRVLGLVERRGFVVRRLAMSEQESGASLVIDLEPRDPSRRAEVVARQLGRLVDVNHVSIAPRDTGSSA
jgi:acetolactate synthase-1/3 small subunit/acetolactate synthase II small subunit